MNIIERFYDCAIYVANEDEKVELLRILYKELQQLPRSYFFNTKDEDDYVQKFLNDQDSDDHWLVILKNDPTYNYAVYQDSTPIHYLCEYKFAEIKHGLFNTLRSFYD